MAEDQICQQHAWTAAKHLLLHASRTMLQSNVTLSRNKGITQRGELENRCDRKQRSYSSYSLCYAPWECPLAEQAHKCAAQTPHTASGAAFSIRLKADICMYCRNSPRLDEGNDVAATLTAREPDCREVYLRLCMHTIRQCCGVVLSRVERCTHGCKS